ncbi:MAG: 1-acyl-sn-glycerol-3-phosphate acyltransferase [Solirubrobacteraceae bacterium]|jgi:1-acyl-sn-glycerol-3-phosphate acyltransferase|nr:1-acyl-sn-glycerol-3-phosphate acyltransferase [Solirubrobacteraceae bacterium]
MTNEEAHRIAREKGVSSPFYALVKAFMVPFMRLYFGLRVTGADLIPRDGPVIIASNHKSFWDSFFIGVSTRRHVRFMGKSELFEKPYAPLLVWLGAFPVRRGAADEDALETARIVLRQGGVLALFPEGTRIRDPDRLGSPRSAVGRLALEAGAPIVPAAISGTQKLFLGPLPKPDRVRVAFSAPIAVAEDEPSPEAARELVSDQLWPQVEQEFGRLRSRPGLIAASLAVLGLGAGVAARRRRRKRSGAKVQIRMPPGRPRPRAKGQSRALRRSARASRTRPQR